MLSGYKAAPEASRSDKPSLVLTGSYRAEIASGSDSAASLSGLKRVAEASGSSITPLSSPQSFDYFRLDKVCIGSSPSMKVAVFSATTVHCCFFTFAGEWTRSVGTFYSSFGPNDVVVSTRGF